MPKAAAAAAPPAPAPPPAEEAVVSSALDVTSARHCVAHGPGLAVGTVRTVCSFVIEARDANGVRRTTGGDTFFVSIRGNSKVRARVRDKRDGSYLVEYLPSVSGFYSVTISLFGETLEASPFALMVINSGPDPCKCACSGDALKSAPNTDAKHREAVCVASAWRLRAHTAAADARC
jgi:hypothetical protein